DPRAVALEIRERGELLDEAWVELEIAGVELHRSVVDDVASDPWFALLHRSPEMPRRGSIREAQGAHPVGVEAEARAVRAEVVDRRRDVLRGIARRREEVV